MSNINGDILNYALLGAIILLVSIVLILFVNFIVKKKDPNKTLTELNNKLTSKGTPSEIYEQQFLNRTNKKNKNKLQSDKPEAADLDPGHILMDVERIYSDMLIGSKDSGICSMLVECKGINYALMSDDEKYDIEKTFAKFINQVTFPIQIYIQTRTLHYEDNNDRCDSKQNKLELELRDKVEKLSALESSESADNTKLNAILLEIKNKQRIYEYLKYLRSQMAITKRNNVILENSYYFVINYFSFNPDKKVNLKNSHTLENIHSELVGKCQQIIQGVSQCGVEANILNSYQLGEILASSFMCEKEHLFKVNDILKSGFFKVYANSPKGN